MWAKYQDFRVLESPVGQSGQNTADVACCVQSVCGRCSNFPPLMDRSSFSGFLIIDRWVCASTAGSLRGSDPAVDGSDPAVDGSPEAEVTDTTVFLLFIHTVKLTSLNVSFCPKRLSLRHKHVLQQKSSQHLHHHHEGFHITDALHHDRI